MSKFELPRFTIEDLRDLPVKEVNLAYICNFNGTPPYDWWHHEDAIMVEEVLNEARRHRREPLEECEATVFDLIEDVGMEDARAIAKFRIQRWRNVENIMKSFGRDVPPGMDAPGL